MTEQEYIDATNLCKARMAARIMSEYIDMGGKQDRHAAEALIALGKVTDALEKIVATTE